MLTNVERIVFITAIIIMSFLTFKTFATMIRIINLGQGKLYFDRMFYRIRKALTVLVSQKTVLKSRPLLSLLHSLIAWAFILYMVVNIGDVIYGFTAYNISHSFGIIGNIYRLFVDIFSVLAILATAFFLFRRFIFSSKRLRYNSNVLILEKALKGIRSDSLIVGLFIILHIGFRFVGESITLQMQYADSWQPLASFSSMIWSGFSFDHLIILQHTSWWIAIGLIIAFIPYFPSSKHAHLFMGPINFLTKENPSGYSMVQPLDFEDESNEQFGVSKLEQLDKSHILDAYACIMCNRCQDVCPAYFTGKSLSPSALEINKRYHINQNKKSLSTDKESSQLLTQYALDDSALWACTTCAACMEICPVGNEPMLDIINIRRDKVMMESKFPKQLQGAFTGMERNQNPWNMNEDRLKWVNESDFEIKVPTVEENQDYEILYWVGCAGAFDQRGQKIAQAFAKILNAAEVNFAVLGNNEACTGDSARRAGNEYLFSMMAETNVDTLNSLNIKKIVTTCPHCLQTLKNEYPQFGGNYEVIHHSEFIENLINSGKLKVSTDEKDGRYTFHDPCYLGRHNKIFDAPRNSLKATGLNFDEMERHHENSFCCGAGGSQMWKEEEEGQQPIRQNRINEANRMNFDTVCTGCPFCMTMLSDAVNELKSEIRVRDIAQIIADKIK
ncbi:MAG: (Fe-S)-binding protein [Calditrichaceae bacterium]